MSSKDSVAKILYLIIFLFDLTIGIIARLYAEEFGSALNLCDGAYSYVCNNLQLVYNISFGASLFFCFMTIFTFLVPAFHRGHFCLKITLNIILIAASLYIPEEFMFGFAQFSRFASSLFLLLQIVILIDFAYDLSEYLIAESDDADDEAGNVEGTGICSNKYKMMYLLVGFGSIILGAAAIVTMYILYSRCFLNIIFITITWVAATFYIVMSISNKTNKGLLAPAIVFMYCVLLCYGGIAANPYEDCGVSGDNGPSIVIGTAIGAISLCWTVMRTSSSAFYLFASSGEKELEDNVAHRQEVFTKAITENRDEDVTDEDGTSDTRAVISVPTEETTNNNIQEVSVWFFHFIMTMGAVYMAMLLSNWATDTDSSSSTTRSVANMTVKIGSQWVTILLYIWTCVAPLCFASRNFEDTHNSLAARKNKKKSIRTPV